MAVVWQYDSVAKAGYLRFERGEIVSTTEIMSGVFVDLDKDGHALGVEFLHVPDHWKPPGAY